MPLDPTDLRFQQKTAQIFNLISLIFAPARLLVRRCQSVPYARIRSLYQRTDIWSSVIPSSRIIPFGSKIVDMLIDNLNFSNTVRWVLICRHCCHMTWHYGVPKRMPIASLKLLLSSNVPKLLVGMAWSHSQIPSVRVLADV